MKKRKFFIRPFAVHWEAAVFMGNDSEVINAKQIYGIIILLRLYGSRSDTNKRISFL